MTGGFGSSAVLADHRSGSGRASGGSASSAGAALLNGHDLASYAADDIRSVIGRCPQDPHLFDATIRDNLRLARPGATDE